MSSVSNISSYLISLAEAAGHPVHSDEHNIVLPSLHGWKVAFFYDFGGLDYIDYFVAPDGTQIDFWEWPEETPGRQELINWMG
jgi:hypothetical protein